MKVLLSTLVCIIMLAGCSSRAEESSYKADPLHEGWGKVEYNGHTYITHDWESSGPTMVHDPDCSCGRR